MLHYSGMVGSGPIPRGDTELRDKPKEIDGRMIREVMKDWRPGPIKGHAIVPWEKDTLFSSDVWERDGEWWYYL